MNFARTITAFAAVAASTVVTFAWAAGINKNDNHQLVSPETIKLAQATPAKGMGMGMGGKAMMPEHADQIEAMQAMHDKMMTAKTPEERHALMAEQRKLMHKGMGMMGNMGSNAMSEKSDHMETRQDMMEHRMDMMQSMMQMMTDRMDSAPETE